MTSIKFGTDGWRGIIAQDFTFDNVRACAQAVADYVKDRGMAGRGLVVGYDTRFASEDFGAAVAEVLAASGVKAYLCARPTPTPVISYNIVSRGAAGAAIITASHNPPLYNGFKYKPEYAGSATPEVTAELERRIAEAQTKGPLEPMPLAEGLSKGLIEYIDASTPYLEHIARLVDLAPVRGAGLKVVVDSMHGAGAGYLKSLLDGGRTEVTEINAERNPLFPGMERPEPIAHNLSRLSTVVRESGASVGLATDGDADRIGIIDERGGFVTQLQVFALLTLYLLEVRGERGPLVKSRTTTSMIYRLGELFKVPVRETPVGFKYIAPIMIRENALIGGEESGGFGFRGHIPERDGILSGLYLLDLMVKLRKSPTQLIDYLYSKVGTHHYDRIDLPLPQEEHPAIIARVSAARPATLDGTRVADIDSEDGFRFRLEDGAWLLVRFSGTEPVVRIYAEAASPERVQRLLAEGRKMAGI